MLSNDIAPEMIVLPPGPLLFTPGARSVTELRVREIGSCSMALCLKFVLTCVDSTAAVIGVSAVMVIDSATAEGRSSMSIRSVRAAVSVTRRVIVCMPASSQDTKYTPGGSSGTM